MRRVLVGVSVMLLACRSEAPPSGATTPTTAAPPTATAATTAAPTETQTETKKPTNEITITDPSQPEATVGKSVVVVGIQTRTKQPTVNGVDVDGDYELSDKKVVARGVLTKTVVPELPPAKDGLEVARRGAGTYYAVIDPATKMIAKTKPA